MNKFKYINADLPISIKNRQTYKLANQKEINEINTYSSILKNIAEFYEENFDGNKIDYVYKDNNDIKILPVKYKRENFPHLTGINFVQKNATEKFEILKNGNNTTPLIIERGSSTFNKLKVLHKIPELIKADATVLSDLKDIKQAKKNDFSKGLQDSKNELLIALKNFQPEFYTPKSLLNIETKDEYHKIPANTILGVFREKDIPNGIHIEPISLNVNALDNMAITTEMLIGMKKYADDLGKQLKRKQKSNLTKGEK